MSPALTVYVLGTGTIAPDLLTFNTIAALLLGPIVWSILTWFLGIPGGSSQTLIGIGASERFRKVRWSVAGNLFATWLITIPASALLVAGFY